MENEKRRVRVNEDVNKRDDVIFLNKVKKVGKDLGFKWLENNEKKFNKQVY